MDLDDYRDGKLTVARAAKGPNSNAPIRGTKNRRSRKVPVTARSPELADWLDWRFSEVTPEDRLRGRVALFPNPTARNPQRRWIWNAMSEEWTRACDQVGVKVRLYEGTKHSFGTRLREEGVDLDAIKDVMGHADRRSTERYARLTGRGVVHALRPRIGTGLAHARNRPENPNDSE